MDIDHKLSQEMHWRPARIRAFVPLCDNPKFYQFSQILTGRTVLIISQCPDALLECHWTISDTCPAARTSCLPSSTRWKTAGSISCFGSRYTSLDLLPKKSAFVGLRNWRGESVGLQKITMLVKSPVLSSDRDGGWPSRNILQFGNTDLIVRTTRPADGRVKSPA